MKITINYLPMLPSTRLCLCFSGLLLHGAKLHSDNQLCLCRHILEDISFQPPEHVRSQQVVELFDLILFRDISKLLQEAFQVTAGHNEMKLYLKKKSLFLNLNVFYLKQEIYLFLLQYNVLT